MRQFILSILNYLIHFKLIYLARKNHIELSLGKQITFHGAPIFVFYKGSRVQIGKQVTINSHSKYNVLGINHPTILSTMTSKASIILGDQVGISGASICAVDKIEIGDQTLLGVNVKIMDTDFHPVNPAGRFHANISQAASGPVTIGKNVFVGANSLILKGVCIGNNSVIGAGSVVSRSIPDNVLAAGNPCKVIRTLNV